MYARVHDVERSRARYGSLFDALVDALDRCDPLADAVADDLDRGALADLEQRLRGPGPAAFESVERLVRAATTRPTWIDAERVARGGQLLLRAGPLAAMVLGGKALVYGYAAPAGNKPLAFSGRLQQQAKRRLVETLRFVHAVCEHQGMDRSGAGFAATVRVRVMHANVRRLLRLSGRWRQDLWAEPINQHDMIATILLFSIIVVRGLEELGLHITVQEREDYLHLWRYVGHVIGCEHELLPRDVPEAVRIAYAIYDSQGPPDDDSRALTRALIASPLEGITDARERAAILRRRPFAEGICRALVGDEIADGLAIPRTPWRHAARVVRAATSTAEVARRVLPGGNTLALSLGRRAWQRAVAEALAGRPAAFLPPHRLLAI